MSTTLRIEPVTRIEGHAAISIHLDEGSRVREARLHVKQFRGFERFAEGRPFWELPSLMARICGICPVSHLIASAKACDEILAVRIPPAAADLRRILNLAQIMQSHALSFFYLASPDLVLGYDAKPETRSLFGVRDAEPRLARDGVHLRRLGQSIVELLGGKRVHPAWVVPGGVSSPLTEEGRRRILAWLPEAREIALRTLAWLRKDPHPEAGAFPSLFLSLVGEDDSLETYDGLLRVTDSRGKPLVDGMDPRLHGEILEERVGEDTFLKSPHFRALGPFDGIYRVGPLARLNNVGHMGTPLADAELERFRAAGPVLDAFAQHEARLIEVLHCAERIEELLGRKHILDPRVRAHASPNASVGVGVSEAPRGTLSHRYEVDDDGIVTSVELLIATGHNALAIDRSLTQVAREHVRAERLTEGMLNRVEAVLRCYDPCLSCSTHALGAMGLELTLHGPDGAVLDRLRRD